MLKYKSYIGTIEHSEEDDCLFGRIVGIEDIITYEGESLSELKQAFQESVDDYLTFCSQTNKVPDKTYAGNLSLRVGPELHKQIALEAKGKGVSINQYLLDLISNIFNCKYHSNSYS